MVLHHGSVFPTQAEYVFPLNVNGNWQGAPFALPPHVATYVAYAGLLFAKTDAAQSEVELLRAVLSRSKIISTYVRNS